jgi:hypothetical protein
MFWILKVTVTGGKRLQHITGFTLIVFKEISKRRVETNFKEEFFLCFFFQFLEHRISNKILQESNGLWYIYQNILKSAIQELAENFLCSLEPP